MWLLAHACLRWSLLSPPYVSYICICLRSQEGGRFGRALPSQSCWGAVRDAEQNARREMQPAPGSAWNLVLG